LVYCVSRRSQNDKKEKPMTTPLDLPPGAPLILALPAQQRPRPIEQLREAMQELKSARARVLDALAHVGTLERERKLRIEQDMALLRQHASRLAGAVMDYAERERGLVRGALEETILKELVLCAASAAYNRASREADAAHRAPNGRGTP
jgi:hypothetical protein